jgi:hypothetical protein
MAIQILETRLPTVNVHGTYFAIYAFYLGSFEGTVRRGARRRSHLTLSRVISPLLWRDELHHLLTRTKLIPCALKESDF